MRILSAFSPIFAACAALLAPTVFGKGSETPSPDGHLTAYVELDGSTGVASYAIRRDRAVVLAGKLGLVRDDADFTQGLKFTPAESKTEMVRDEYDILTAKRRHNTYVANRRVYHLQATGGQKLDIIFQVSNDGVAFRYAFPETSSEVRRLKEEVTSFGFPSGARAWLQPMSVAKTGWAEVNPCYEEYYQKDIPVGTPSPLAGWVYPALFRIGDTWALITEGSLARNYCGTRLRAESPNGEYQIGFPDPRENFRGGAVNPESTLPWTTPWRIVAVGSLKTIVESTLGTDLADPAVGIEGRARTPLRAAHGRERSPGPTNGSEDTAAQSSMGVAPLPDSSRTAVPIASRPGKASWSWPLLGDRNTTFDVQKQFVDYAAEMGWQYCLIDALWDKQIGYEKIKELVAYARTKNVAILVWYNSAGDWNKAPQTPRDRLLTHESRIQEFERLKDMGVAGLKIDFFGGDGQSMIGYYHDILADAAPYGFMMNFHGATLPRGWQRTYPQLMTMEAIKGLEYITFEQKNADEEPTHAAMLPFARNIFDPMDFTPVVLDRIRKIERRTTSAFELALSVLFTSGIQHYAEIPSGMAKAPDYVRELMKRVPSVWDDTKFIDGFPGKLVVLARQGNGRWYVAGINAETTEKKLTLDLSALNLADGVGGTLVTDGDGGNLSFHKDAVKLSHDSKTEVTIAPHGGFVMFFE